MAKEGPVGLTVVSQLHENEKGRNGHSRRRKRESCKREARLQKGPRSCRREEKREETEVYGVRRNSQEREREHGFEV